MLSLRKVRNQWLSQRGTTITKRRVFLAASVAVLALIAPQAEAQQPPIATYNTVVFQYWHLNGAALKDYLPPLDAKE